ncbi:MAG: YidC/Oxa1 family membrane protein insertase [Synergistes sp.]|nr:YidC/Oxa1 family membrane protein insertase [Synergistes sp.]
MGAIWDGASNLLLELLKFLYGITNSYGLAIILLTVLVRLALYPLNQKQMVSMQQMQRIQPRLKVLQEKYANDREKMQRETMALYKEYKVNPAAGCLPILLQLPILILLFNILREYDFADTTFLGVYLGSSFTSGLAKALGVAASAEGEYSILSILSAIPGNPAGLANFGLYIGNLFLIIAISVLTLVQQKMSGGNNPQMATMNAIMPFFMAFICLSMPGGVMLYWGLSSLIGVAQQYMVIRKTSEEMAVKPNLYKNKPTLQHDDDDDEEDEDE